MQTKSTLSVSDRIRGVLSERHVSQEALGKYLHMGRMSISRRMSGQTPWTADDLIAVGTLFGIHPGRFFDGVEGVVAAPREQPEVPEQAEPARLSA